MGFEHQCIEPVDEGAHAVEGDDEERVLLLVRPVGALTPPVLR